MLDWTLLGLIGTLCIPIPCPYRFVDPIWTLLTCLTFTTTPRPQRYEMNFIEFSHSEKYPQTSIMRVASSVASRDRKYRKSLPKKAQCELMPLRRLTASIPRPTLTKSSITKFGLRSCTKGAQWAACCRILSHVVYQTENILIHLAKALTTVPRWSVGSVTGQEVESHVRWAGCSR